MFWIMTCKKLFTMKKDLCEIVIILDESGSMGSCKTDTIGGVNLFLDNQKRIRGEARVTLVKFSDYYKIINDSVPLAEIIYLDENNYTPSNTTALLDAVGRTINSIGKRLADTPEVERPESVIFAIITDGYENASTEFSRSQVFSMVSHQRNKYSWRFIFLGADIDAWGEEIGINLNVNIQKNDLARSYKGLSHHVLCCRIDKMFENTDSFDLGEGELDRKLKSLGTDQEIK
jgi:hypothetical protein